MKRQTVLVILLLTLLGASPLLSAGPALHTANIIVLRAYARSQVRTVASIGFPTPGQRPDV